MKTISYIAFWAVCALVMVPVFLGLMCDELTPVILALAWGAMWWAIFTHTKSGKKVFRKGYRIACRIMGDCDV